MLQADPQPASSRSTAPYDLIVLGGGILGLATAFEEVQRGKRVAVVDANAFGTQASWAAAGILATRAGLVGNSPFREFHLRSVALYPEWLRRIEAAAERAVPYTRSGDYQIFPLDDEASRRALHEREDQLRREKGHDYSVEDAWPEFLKPFGSPSPVRVFHYPGEAYVNNRVLLEVLEAALRARGADLFPHTAIAKWSHADGVNVLEGEGSGGETFRAAARQVLVAAGNGSNALLGLRGLSLPLFAVKGQLAMLPRFHAVDTMIHGGEKFYLIPRGDVLIAGATTEHGAETADFDAVGSDHLAAQLQRFFPGVQPRWTETWAGLRPRCRDRLPAMGWVDEAAGIAVSTGHYKSGISLAPLSARCISALLNGERPPASLAPFDPRRKGALAPV